jgi:hypothetical protein
VNTQPESHIGKARVPEGSDRGMLFRDSRVFKEISACRRFHAIFIELQI